jgi:hypothetical protein
MSNELSAQDLLPPEIGLTLLGFEKSEQGWLVGAEGRTRSECPSCGTQSTARHSRYWQATARSSRSRQAGGAAIVIESMAMSQQNKWAIATYDQFLDSV